MKTINSRKYVADRYRKQEKCEHNKRGSTDYVSSLIMLPLKQMIRDCPDAATSSWLISKANPSKLCLQVVYR